MSLSVVRWCQGCRKVQTVHVENEYRAPGGGKNVILRCFCGHAFEETWGKWVKGEGSGGNDQGTE